MLLTEAWQVRFQDAHSRVDTGLVSPGCLLVRIELSHLTWRLVLCLQWWPLRDRPSFLLGDQLGHLS